jgi:ATP-dependent Clp protease ATP-binding subunit ClpA
MAMEQLFKRAHEAATELGDGWVGAEHLLVALSETGLTGDALVACGVMREWLINDIRALPNPYESREALPEVAPPGALRATAETNEVLARAEGLAAGLGSAQLGPEHVLLALIWGRRSSAAIHLLEKHGATAQRVVDELSRLEVEVPSVPPPQRPSWGPPFSVYQEDFERLTADLKRAGVLYRFNRKGDEVLMSIEQTNPGHPPL